MNDLTTLTIQPIPSIVFIFINGHSHTMPILGLCRGLSRDGQRPHAFKFIDCTPEVITDEFIDWYFSMVLPCLNTNPFMYRLSIATTPKNFQQILALPQETEHV